MKLPIKKKYFDQIKSGVKAFDFRDAHITFKCEETGEILVKEIKSVYMYNRNMINEKFYDEGVLEDDKVIGFNLGETRQ